MKWKISQGEENESHTLQGLSLNSIHQILSTPIFYIDYSIRDNRGLRKNIIHFHNPNTSLISTSFLTVHLMFLTEKKGSWIFFLSLSSPLPTIWVGLIWVRAFLHIRDTWRKMWKSYRQSISKMNHWISKIWLLNFSIYTVLLILKIAQKQTHTDIVKWSLTEK